MIGNNYESIMVDLETLDTRPTAVIISLGACRVNWHKNAVTDSFYRVIDSNSCTEAGLTSSPETEAWWARQSEEARSVFTDKNVTLLDALTAFSDYLRQPIFTGKKMLIWGNGSDFDNVILANAYDALGFDAPWKFYHNRCYRTVMAAHKDRVTKLERQGVYHNALADAEYQARMLLQLKGIIHEN